MIEKINVSLLRTAAQSINIYANSCTIYQYLCNLACLFAKLYFQNLGVEKTVGLRPVSARSGVMVRPGSGLVYTARLQLLCRNLLELIAFY